MASKDLTRYYKIQRMSADLDLLLLSTSTTVERLSDFGQAIITAMRVCARLR